MATISAEQNAQPRISEVTREWVLERLHVVVEIAMGRVNHLKTSPNDRIKWSRIVISAAQACNSVLRDVELESLKQQVHELKQLVKGKLSDEQSEDS